MGFHMRIDSPVALPADLQIFYQIFLPVVPVKLYMQYIKSLDFRYCYYINVVHLVSLQLYIKLHNT